MTFLIEKSGGSVRDLIRAARRGATQSAGRRTRSGEPSGRRRGDEEAEPGVQPLPATWQRVLSDFSRGSRDAPRSKHLGRASHGKKRRGCPRVLCPAHRQRQRARIQRRRFVVRRASPASANWTNSKMPSKRAARLKRKKQKRWQQLPEAKPPLVPDEFAAERRGMEIFLRQTTSFRLALALYNDPVARDETIRSLQEEFVGQGMRVLTLDLRELCSEYTLLAQVKAAVESASLGAGERVAVMVVNLESQVDYSPELAQLDGLGTSFLETANLHRELFPSVCSGPLILWMTELLERALISYAPDLWHWRSHVFDLRTRSVQKRFVASADENAWPSGDLRRHPHDRLRRLEEELAGYRKTGSLIDEFRTLNFIGQARLDMGDARHARSVFEENVKIAKVLDRNNLLISALGNLGLSHFELGDVKKAISFYGQALVLSRKIGDQRNEANSLVGLGLAHAQLSEPRKAITFYESALPIYRKLGDEQGEAASLGNIGNEYDTLGDLSRAIEYHERHLKIARKVASLRDEGVALGSLANAYARLGEAYKSINLYKRVLAIARNAADQRLEGSILGNMGNVYANLGKMHEAQELYSQALIIARSTGDRSNESNTLGNLAEVYSSLGNSREALQLFEQNLALAREIGDRHSESNGLWNSARVFFAVGKSG